MHILDCKIEENIDLNGYHILRVNAPPIAEEAEPGQFVNIKVSKGFDPLLRRPMSIMDVQGDSILLFIKIVGKGTKLIAEKKVGECLNLLGPLGRGFEERDVVLVGGGTGIAPLIFYKRKRTDRVMEFYAGFRTKPHDFLLQILNREEVIISTEDGSHGQKGTVIDLLMRNKPGYTVYAAGPVPMLRKLETLLNPSQVFVSVESIMACGTGICMGCAIKERGKPTYKRVCIDGPVFRLSEVEL